MSIIILTDTASDFGKADEKKYGIRIIPLKIAFGDDEFLDNVNMSHEEFYRKLQESDKLPQTSQITSYEFAEAFETALSEADEIICITMSSKLSGTYQSAVIASEDFQGRVSVVDSLNVTIGERILVLHALDLIKQGLSREEIVKQLEQRRTEIRLIAMLDTLEYLKKGGRISSAVAFAGTVLSVKPVISISDGEVAIRGKARGSKKGNNLLNQFVKQGGGIDFEKPLYLAYSGNDDSLLRTYINDSRELYNCEPDELAVTSLGAAIGTHIGPGAIGLAYFEKTDE